MLDDTTMLADALLLIHRDGFGNRVDDAKEFARGQFRRLCGRFTQRYTCDELVRLYRLIKLLPTG